MGTTAKLWRGRAALDSGGKPAPNAVGRLAQAPRLDEQTYPAERLLREYTAQQHVERGFRVLKAPLFFTSRAFVKKPQQAEALALVMALTLGMESVE